MNKIERYHMDQEGYIMLDNYDGEWCKYSDVEELIKQNQDLIETIQAMIEIGEVVNDK